MRDTKRTELHRAQLTHRQGVPAVGQAPEGDKPFAPSPSEHEEGVRAAAEANAAAAAEEFRQFGQRRK
jgi:hypothetical protein